MRYLWILLLALLALPAAATAVAGSSEYALKAVLLKKLVAFVEWPADQMAGPRVCVLGNDKFGQYLQDAFDAPNQTVLHLGQESPDFVTCDLLWLSDSETDTYETWLQQLQHRPVLTVSDIPRFANRGGMINLRLVNRRVRFVVNAQASEEAGLRISHKLLRLAEIVETEPHL